MFVFNLLLFISLDVSFRECYHSQPAIFFAISQPLLHTDVNLLNIPGFTLGRYVANGLSFPADDSTNIITGHQDPEITCPMSHVVLQSVFTTILQT